MQIQLNTIQNVHMFPNRCALFAKQNLVVNNLKRGLRRAITISNFYYVDPEAVRVGSNEALCYMNMFGTKRVFHIPSHSHRTP